ncbi:putative ribonuclease H-like domain-containing protein [Tanacetum coccineum]
MLYMVTSNPTRSLVYVDDIIFRSIKKSLCVEFEQMMHKRFQMSSMGELTFFLGLQVKQKDDGIFISQDKYVADILKKFDFSLVKTASTPIETNKALLKDEEAEDVDVYLYRSMIGSLMYLTASRPDIMFVVCACARFQVTPKVSHLHAVKRIFRYLKALTGNPQHKVVAAANCYGQITMLMIYHKTFIVSRCISDKLGVKTGSCNVNAARQDLVLLGEKFVDQYNMVACLERTDGNAEFHQIVDFFTTSSIQYALIFDGKTVVISESSMRSDLHFNDEDGMLRNLDPTSKIFLMYPRFLQLFLNNQIDLAEPFNDVYVTPVHTKKIFTNMKRQNKDFSGTVTPLFASMLVPQVVEGEGEDDKVVRAATTTTSLEAEQERGMKLFKIGTSRRNNLDKENVSKQGRNLKTRPMFEEGDFDDDFDDIDDMVNEAMENVEGDTVNAGGAVNTATTGVSAASASVTTAGVSISTAEPRTPPTTTTTAFEDEDLTIAQTLVKMRSQKDKEKGKGVAFRAAQEESARPTRILPTARPTRILPTIDPKDKGKGIIANGSSNNYKIFSEMLDDFDRQDVVDLYRLVKERCETISPEGYDRLLWGDLVTLFESSKEDEI